MPKGYWIAHVTVTDPEQYQQYAGSTREAFQKYGATVLARTAVAETWWWDGSVSSTSRIRPADTAARGTCTNMMTAVMIANRIWMMYWRNAVRLPIDISPLSTRKNARPSQLSTGLPR